MHFCPWCNALPLLLQHLLVMCYVYTASIFACVNTRPRWCRCRKCEANSSEQNRQNYNRFLHFDRSSFAVPLSPCFSYRVGSSSDSCRLCQFRWDSAEQTALPRSKWPESCRRFALVCVSWSNQKEMRVILRTRALESFSLLHLRSISTHLV